MNIQNENNRDNGGGGGGDFQGAVQHWYHSIPPITKWYMTGCLLTTVAVQLELISPYDLWLNFVAIWHDFEVWRLVTNFLFFGYLDLNFVFYMYFMVRHSRSLEDTTYRGRSADYFFLWLFSAGSLLLIAFLFVHYGIRRMNFLASSLTSVIVYVWSKHNPHLRMSFLYLFTFSAPWLPWVILLLGWFLGQDPIDDVLGIGIGHIYYFFETVYPNQSGRHLLRTPRLLKVLFNEE